MNQKQNAKFIASNRIVRTVELPKRSDGGHQGISEYYEENIFDFRSTQLISDQVTSEIIETYRSKRPLSREHAELVAEAATEWATEKGATHFCHWFQPLTGATAEKHDSFLDFAGYTPIERLSPSKLMMGEPDASSFPNGGSRSTFEARGYTTWDLSSPMFLLEGANGKTLCIPTAFVSYNGDALDVKTPLLRSIDSLGNVVKDFLHLCGDKEVDEVIITCGAEQEYFLIDKAFYFNRPDLVVSGRTLLGKNSSKDQQMSDHYFGTIPVRVLAFMQELDLELHRLGIPSKTRHNEVAPGQFEIAPQFTDANLAADHNQLIMIKIKEIAEKHDLVALLHEKPFQNINGSGKHLNWSMGDNLGHNLLDPGERPQSNYKFLAVVCAITEAVYRHSGALRLSSASISNDCRLGGHEAPPSVLSVFLGDALTAILNGIAADKNIELKNQEYLDLGAKQLAQLIKDNTDRNRTSPFAFTGNRFEFRAVGSSQSIGIPLSIINAAVCDVFMDLNAELKRHLESGIDLDTALLEIIKKYYKSSLPVVMNGDGYTQDWLDEAKKRGLPNYKNSIEALDVYLDESQTKFLTRTEVYRPSEIKTRYNIFQEHYYQQSRINLTTLLTMVKQNVIPCGIEYKDKLLSVVSKQAVIGLKGGPEELILKDISDKLDGLYHGAMQLERELEKYQGDAMIANKIIAEELNGIAEKIRDYSDSLEMIIPDTTWQLPRYFEMLFIR
ncbi:MAG: glutamine synthetase III [Bacteriovoracaceae bacterium]|nr:glutamine synthetase III [Bacteriovoracaceae bacterium]